MGRHMRRDTVRRLTGAKLDRMIEVLKKHGLVAMTLLRLVPLAPFAVEGLVAGAVGVRLWEFMLGTALGMLPGTLAATVFGDQMQAALEDPSQTNYWLIGAVVALVIVATLLVRRWLLNSAAGVQSRVPAKRHGVGSARVA